MTAIKKHIDLVRRICLSATAIILALTTFAQTVNKNTLTPGETIPDLPISGFVNKPEKNVPISQLYKSGALIINFWATWCAPCVREMEVLADEVKKQNGKLAVLSISYEKSAVVKQYLKSHPEIAQSGLWIAAEDITWNKLFFHQTLPHNVWVNGKGVIKSITGGDEISHQNVSKFLSDNTPQMTQKTEIRFDPERPLTIPDSLLEFRAMFNKKIPGVLQSGSSISSDGWGFPNMTKFLNYNALITHLFYDAYDMPGYAHYSSIAYLVEVQTQDSTKFFWPGQFVEKGSYKGMLQSDWDKENTYTYELRTSKAVPDSIFLRKVISDLEFNLNVKTWKEQRKKECIVVTYPVKSDKIKISLPGEAATCGVIGDKIVVRNCQLGHLLEYMARRGYSRTEYRVPYLDQTGLTAQLNFTVELGPDKSLYRSQDYLEKCITAQTGILFEKKVADIPVLIIKSL